MIFKIIELRAYAQAKDIYDSTEMTKRPKTKMMDKVSEITMSLAAERIRKANEEAMKEEDKS